MPLWAQVSADLRRRCVSGEFGVGVPGEHELCAEYEVSRHTVREALRALRSEGVISSHRGRGSIVRPGFSQKVGTVYSLFRSVEAQGSVQTSTVLRLETARDPAIALRLGLAEDALLVVLERIRCADGEPLAHDVSWLPHTLAHPILDADFRRTALYDELDTRVDIQIDAGSERMSAVLPEAELGRQLGLAPGAPTLYIERLASARGRPVEWRQTHVRADRFSVETEWDSASGLTLTASAETPDTTRPTTAHASTPTKGTTP